MIDAILAGVMPDAILAGAMPEVILAGAMADAILAVVVGGGAVLQAGLLAEIVEMLSTRFMQYALLAGVCVGIAGPLLGSYLVHRELSLIGEALAHTAFAGVGLGFLVVALFGVSAARVDAVALSVALGVAVLAALGMQLLAVETDAYGDVPVAVMLTGGFALGILVINLDFVRLSGSIDDYLFGNIVLLDRNSALLMALLALVIVGVVLAAHKQLAYITFDREAASMARIDVRLYDTLLVVLTAGFVVAAMYIMGAILVAAMLVVPVAAATLLVTGFRRSMVVAVGIGQISVLVGISSSFIYGLQAGAMIVMVAIAFYFAAVTRSVLR